ncbi:MAG: permease-like cell division protein FtsX [Oscillospiraceae bacterium]|nr:permease-like cell division protein FtsX [Oscillospiraceae bacterium]
MRLHNFFYLFKEGTKNIFSNKLMSFACIGVLVACLLLIGSAVIFTLNVNNIVGVVVAQNEFIVFLDDNMTEDDIGIFDVALDSIDNIASKTFVSSEEALAQEKENLGDEAYILEGIDASTFPNKYVLRVNDLSQFDDTVSQVSALNGAMLVNSKNDVVDMLVGIKNAVQYAGAGIVLILVVVSIVIITNTIKLTVFSRRKEINIMKYVGATDSFIRMPFLVEGMMIGLISASIAFLMLGVSYTYFVEYLSENYGSQLSVVFENTVRFMDISLYMFAGFAVLGVFIGVVGSGIFVRRHLKV